MKNKFKIAAAVMLTTLVLFSCTSIDIESKITDKVVSMSPLPEQIDYKIAGSFTKEIQVFFTINGLIPVSQLEIDAVINNAVLKYHGDGVVNLRVNDMLSGMDILLQAGLGVGGYLLGYLFAPNALSAPSYGSIGASVMQFCLQSRTVTVSGDVFKLAESQ